MVGLSAFLWVSVHSFSFRGGPVLKLDDKSRVTVPAVHKEILGAPPVHNRLVVSKNPDGCLSLFPLPVWEGFEAELLKLPAQHVGWKRLYVGSATDVTIDTSSRVLIPPELKVWAGLDKTVMFMGVGSYFELWDTARYAEREAKLLESPAPDAVLGMVIG